MSTNMNAAPPYVTSDKNSFAYVSAHGRWATILASAVKDLQNSISSCAESDKKEEGLKIVEAIDRLKEEIQSNQELTPIIDDGEADVTLYNHQLEKSGPLTWCDLQWLYGECYLYRRLSSLFKISVHWKSYDIFFDQKISTFRSSRTAVVELAERYHSLAKGFAKQETKSESMGDQVQEQLFYEMCEMSLWGNATDLSLLTNISYEDIQKLQSSEARKNKENILVNHLPEVFNTLREAASLGKGDRRIDIVLDNAGFELYVDLILASYLIHAGVATRVVLHPKSIPWFVSDTLTADFEALLQILADPKPFYETTSAHQAHNGALSSLTSDQVEHLKFLSETWNEFRSKGQLEVRPDSFWTHPSDFWKLPEEAPTLFEDLKKSKCVIFKGDLNYRKLTGDAAWNPTTPFTEALGPLGPSSGINILTLRTCKADVVVDLEHGVDEKLRGTPGGGGVTGRREWAWSGKWAVCSFSKGK